MIASNKVTPDAAAAAATDAAPAPPPPALMTQQPDSHSAKSEDDNRRESPIKDDDSEDSQHSEGDEEAPAVDEVARSAAFTRLASSHLIQMRNANRVSVIGFRGMISDEKPVEIVTPNRLITLAAAPKTLNSKICSFDVIKGLYVYLLLPIHLTNLMQWVKKNDTYASTYLPYETTDHGQEYIMGMMLLSGWLSNATMKADCTVSDFFQKKLVRLMPSYFLGAIPLSLFCICLRIGTGEVSWSSWRIGQLFVQFVLEIFTLGPWNPAMIWWTSNLPLWFMDTLLWYYYLSWWYIRWLRSIEVTSRLFLTLLGLLLFRLIAASATLVALTYIYPKTYEEYGFLIHTWAVVQIPLPFMGATLAEIAARVGPLKLSKKQLWVLTDAWTVVTVSLAFFIGPFSSQKRVAYFFSNLCDYGDLLVAPFLLFGLYLYSHDFSSLSYLYSMFPRFWADLTRMSFPAFLFHWPLMISLTIASQDSLLFSKPMDVVYISGMCVLLSAFIDSYVVLALEDSFLGMIKPRLAKLAKKLFKDEKVEALPVKKK